MLHIFRKYVFFGPNRHLPFARVILRHSPFDGGRPVRCRAGICPPTFFSPGPAHPIPPAEGGAGRRGNNNNNNNDTMASPRGPGATIAPRAVRLILSGIPLSLT